MSWADRLLDKAYEATDSLDDGSATVAQAVLAELRSAADALDRIGERALRALAERVTGASGPTDYADILGLLALGGVSYDERRRLLRSTAADALAERDRREADARAVRSALLSAGQAGLKAAATVLLAAL